MLAIRARLKAFRTRGESRGNAILHRTSVIHFVVRWALILAVLTCSAVFASTATADDSTVLLSHIFDNEPDTSHANRLPETNDQPRPLDRRDRIFYPGDTER